MKLLISESQLEVLIVYINEANHPNKEVLEEGWKEVVLGAAMLMGVGLTGSNAQTAENALNNADILNKIESTLEGPNIDKLANTLEKGGLENAMDKIQANADQIKTNLENAAKKKGLVSNVQIYNTKNQKMVKSKVRQGYAVSDIEVTQDTVWTPQDKIELDNSVEIVFDANIFKTGTFDLADSVSSELKSTIETILMMGGTITSIQIESSTDTEPIKMGNEKLAKLRGVGVQKYLTSIGVSADMSINALPEQGPDVYSRTMTSQEREQVRKETSKYRYVKVRINSVTEPKPQKEEKAFEVIEKVKYELVRVNNMNSGTIKLNGGKPLSKTTKKFKLKKCKVNGKSLKCSFQN
jgi:outer membrane protein OmpA-like peptidoglycan-associated protein